jgi:hypothetical protein
MPPRGVHRVKDPEEFEDGVWVLDAGTGFEVTETVYRAQRWAPPLEKLPWAPSEDGNMLRTPNETP